MFALLSLSLLVFVAGAIALAWWSHRAVPPAGLVGGRLRPCPAAANCVSSEAGAPARAVIAPLAFTDDPTAAWARAKAAVVAAGGHIEHETDDYLWATFRTPVLRFVDDVELRRDRDHHVIHVRSASRVGHRDLGVNRRRVENLRARLTSAPP
jgi:uncharacterized protein (DUF1499 family)